MKKFLTLLALASALLVQRAADACCTNLLCDYCISSSDACTNRCIESNACVVTWVPTCNTFGCNCNNTGPDCQCGTPNGGSCGPIDCCADTAAANAKERFKQVDADGNGRVSVDEAKAWLVKSFGKDWTRHVDKADVAAGKTEAKIAQVIFDRMDKNHDKSITPDEFDSTLAPPAKKK